jgi:hypothetical protein
MCGARRTARRNKTGPSFDVRFVCVSDVDIVDFYFSDTAINDS